MIKPTLNLAKIHELHNYGYVVLANYLSKTWQIKLQERLSLFVTKFPNQKGLLLDPIFLDFATSDELLSLPYSLFGTDFLLHHMNGRVITSSNISKMWHHDRDGTISARKEGIHMYHIMVYPGGLSEEVSPLVVKPKSHLYSVERYTPNHLSEKIEADDVIIHGNPGLVVVIDSALWHMRPSKISLSPRFDLNVSFCEPVGYWPERNKLNNILQQVQKKVNPQHSFMFRIL